MRVIGGTFRSRLIQAPPGPATRPTSDRLRETLFNILAPRIAGARFLDLYAGSGAVGIEALSRGAAEVVFVERGTPALKALRANLAGLGITLGAQVVSETVARYLRQSASEVPFDLVFLDPPYDAAREYAVALSALGGAAAATLASNGLVVAEHFRKDHLDDQYATLHRTRLHQQGDAALSFYAFSNEG
jgi:16S rRNA (guanine966-N2)-methyltransferase